MWRVSAGSAVLALMALIVGGCGGTARRPRRPALTKPSAIEPWPSASKPSNSQKAWAPFPAGSFDPANPDPAKLAVVARWLTTEVAPTFDSWRDDLEALGAPTAGTDAWASVVAEAKATSTFNDAQIAAASSADPTAFAKATADLRASHDRLATATGRAGVAACADLFGR